jgi:glucose-6-phosphate 1-dehydrogenase
MVDPGALADPLRFERTVPPCALVIFGANGDLTMRKLMPSLYRLAYERRLPQGFAVVGTSRTPLSDEQFRAKMRESVEKFLENSPFDAALWEDFERGLFYVSGNLFEAPLYEEIKTKLAAIAAERKTGGNVLFYLSTQPSQYGPAIERIGAAGLRRAENAWRRIVIEKPFGHDTASARELAGQVHGVFEEDQVYRIDHYLGKETVQNILAFRFGNGIFEPLWNRRYVNHVQITGAEAIGVEGRGAYYQEAGALRDMIQNHLLQVMATITMEPPAVYEPNAVRDERAKLLRSIRILKPDEVLANAVPGQYAGFRQEPGVKPDAAIDTYAALTLTVENWRWAGVPFYIRTGKKLPKRVTDVAIQFNRAPLSLFSHDGAGWPNLLVLRIQPEEGISLRFFSKQPGNAMTVRPVTMDFNYGTSFGVRSPTAYETLLLDAMEGDATLYTRQDMVDASWNVVQPILDVWANTKFDFPNYEPGTWGPRASDDMLARSGHEWRVP